MKVRFEDIELTPPAEAPGIRSNAVLGPLPDLPAPKSRFKLQTQVNPRWCKTYHEVSWIFNFIDWAGRIFSISAS